MISSIHYPDRYTLFTSVITFMIYIILKGFKIIFLYDWYKYNKIIGYYDKFRSVIKSEKKNTVNQKNIYFIR